MMTRAVWSLAAAAALSLGLAGPSLAEKPPKDPVQERFDKIEKQLREMRSIIVQARDTGQPVSVRVTTDPDPTLEALQTRMDDLEASSRTRNDQIDNLVHDLDAAKREAAAAAAGLKSAQDRLAKIEARLKTLDEAATSAAAGDASAAPPLAVAPVSPPLRPGPPPAARPSGDADAAFKSAKQLLLEGQYAAASGAFQSFVETYGDTPNGAEAHYWLGETLFIRGLYGDAATAYIGSIRGWPQTAWAPDAVVKLSRSLIALSKPADACRALDEFNRRYPQASPQTKSKAADARAAAKCA